ncbi:MAG: DUF3313 domain-containing protein [Alphaproteobacteria bacterium]|nr:DUF3313 domain-containing protein [Alphaproteobacteria bacterium]
MALPGMALRCRFVRPILALAAIASLAACATPKVAPSGFLASYDQLRPSEETGAVRVQTSAADRTSAYTAVLIEEATLIETRLSPQEAEAIRSALSEALALELARDRVIVVEPGAGALRVRYAIALVETSNVALNVLTTALIGAVDYGSMALEAEVLDSITGERIAAMTWARGAKLTNVLGAYSSTGNARALAPEFARRLQMLIAKDMPG